MKKSIKYKNKLHLLFIVGGMSALNDEGRTNVARSLANTLTLNGISNEIMRPSLKNMFTLINRLAHFRSFAILILLLGPSSYISLLLIMFLGFLRKIYKSKFVLILSQPTLFIANKFATQLFVLAMRLTSVDLIFVQSRSSYLALRTKGALKVKILPNGVDLEKFRPLESVDELMYLRKRYSFSQDKPIILHVGPIKRSRNVEILIPLCKQGKVDVLIIGRPHDYEEETLRKLVDSDCIVINKFLPKIEDIYRLSNVYVFPTTSIRSVIEMPLSILEAMASNLVVVTVSLSGITTYWRNDPISGIHIVEDPKYIPTIVTNIVDKGLLKANTREKVKPFGWRNIAKLFLKHVHETLYK